MKIFIVTYLQKIFNFFGIQVQRKNKNVNIDSALEEQLRLAGKNIKCIFEVGAADGRDCLTYAARCPDATIFAFEPLPQNFDKLKNNTSNEPRIITTNAALSNTSGTSSFYITALDDASSLLPSKKTNSTFDKYMASKSTIDVKTTTIDDECKKNKIKCIDILKLDTQGFELPILKGAQIMLEEKAVKVIYTEVQFIQLYENASLFHEIVSFLESKNYKLHNIYNLVHNQDGQLAWGDAIFLPNNI